MTIRRIITSGALSAAILAATILPALDVAPAAAFTGTDLEYSLEYYYPTGATYGRDARGIAVDLDGTHLYLGYNNWRPSGEGPTNLVSLVDDSITATQAHRGKCIAVDDLGRVYVTHSTILIYDASLNPLYEITDPSNTEGLLVRREGGDLVVYASDRTLGRVFRWVLTEDGGDITGHVAAGLDGDGEIAVPTGVRGITMGADGWLLVANPGADAIYRVSADGATTETHTFTEPYYMAFFDDQFVVTNGTAKTMTLVNYPAMTTESVLTPAWTDLGIAEPGGTPAITGIAAFPDGTGFYFTLEHGDMAGGLGFEPVVRVDIDDGTPVQLADFSARASGALVRLDWALQGQPAGEDALFQLSGSNGVHHWPVTVNQDDAHRYSATDESRYLRSGGQIEYILRQQGDDARWLELDRLTVNLEAVIMRSRLLGAYPNPFNPVTRISYDLAEAGPVRLTVHDLSGRLVRTLVAGQRLAGAGQVIWDGTDEHGQSVAAGVYFARLEAEGVDLSKITLVK